MFSVWDTCLHAIVVATLAGAVQAGVLTSEGDSGLDRKSWHMIGLGRGLQILKLGKRGSTELSELLESLSGPHQMVRRQPPLPRYGRGLPDTTRDLLDILTSEGSVPSDQSPSRRLKRSAPTSMTPEQFPPFELWEPRVYRAVALPRYGRFYSPKSQQKKAVPRPRIGRSGQTGSTDQSSAKDEDVES